jgi:hypothetical protein
MPVGGSSDARRAILVALAGVVAAAGIIGIVLFLSSDEVKVAVSEGEFTVGRVTTLLDAQDRDHRPVCLNDPAGGDRPVCVFHTGRLDDQGWLAYDAQTGGCPLDIDVEAQELVGCDGERFPFTGGDLPDYPTRVENGRVLVDLNGADPDATTTTTIAVTGDGP